MDRIAVLEKEVERLRSQIEGDADCEHDLRTATIRGPQVLSTRGRPMSPMVRIGRYCTKCHVLMPD